MGDKTNKEGGRATMAKKMDGEISSKRLMKKKIPNLGELMDIYEQLMDKPNVFLCYIGEKKAKNPKKENRIEKLGLSIVCGVKEKILKKDLSPKEIIPKAISWLNYSPYPQEIKTDVVKMNPNFEYMKGTTIFGPGDKAIYKGFPATIGAALKHPVYGFVLTTAGHLFEDLPPYYRYTTTGSQIEVKIVSNSNPPITGKLVRKVMNTWMDYALIQVTSIDSQVRNKFEDNQSVGPLYPLYTSDINKPLDILTNSGKKPVTCKGVHGYAHWENGDKMSDIILTTYNSIGGDSGACLVTSKLQLSGFLVGKPLDETDYSVFIPASPMVHGEHSLLI
jgi:hypothetical protein